MNATQRCDVLIVGGGPAGSSCAWQLQRLGFDTIVLDRAQFPRDKLCAGWVTPQIIETLQLDLDDFATDNVLQPLRGFRCGVLGGRATSIRYDSTVSYGIRRCEFDHYLLRRSGSQLRLGEPLHNVEERAGGWLINQCITATMLVGAGGHFCPVARLLGADPGRGEHAIYAQESEVRLNSSQIERCAIEPVLGELYFCADLDGYGWCVRKGDFLNVGFGHRNHRGLHGAVTSFTRWLTDQGRIPTDVDLPFKGHAYLLHSESARLAGSDGVLLVGDATGLAVDASGEGIRPAVESGLLAAQSIARALHRHSRDAVGDYAAALRSRFGARASTQVRSGIASRLRKLAAPMLIPNARFARSVILDRHFLQRRLPALPAPEPAM